MLRTPILGTKVAGRYLSRLSVLLEAVPEVPLEQALELLVAARQRGSRVYVMGNGGSAATSLHIANDLMKTAHVDGHKPLRAMALVENVALLTAWANDAGYDRVFAEQLRALVEPGDVVLALSASGNSPNVVAGVKVAQELGAITIGLVGFDGGIVGSMVDVAVQVPSDDYGLVEDVHIAVGHALSAGLRQAASPLPAQHELNAV